VTSWSWCWANGSPNDLKTAVHTLKLGADCPTDTVCFHAQQCVEKYLKAVLILEGIDFPKTHDIEAIVNLLPARTRPPLGADEQDALTDYAIGPRYPGWPELSLVEARQAVALARRVRRDVRRLLPRQALRRSRK
jgi:HEPN domain-containing protein